MNAYLRHFFFFAVVCFGCPALSQQKSGQDFSKIDASITVSPKNHIIEPKQLVQELAYGLEDSTQRVRAIYTWIAKNIRYDLAAYRTGGKSSQTVTEILKTRSAICSGYSTLFMHLCDLAGIQTVIINGYAKGYGYVPYQKFLSTNHAWNAVYLTGQWNFVDVTWASGIPEEITGRRQVIDLDAYFFIPPEKLIKTHMPEDPAWQLQAGIISLAEFETGIVPSNEKVAENAPDKTHAGDVFDQDIARYKRSLQFNPKNEGLRTQLSFAYAYKAISIIDAIWKFSYKNLIDTIPSLEVHTMAFLDSALLTSAVIINPRNKTIISDEVNYQKGVFAYEIAVNVFEKASKIQELPASDRQMIDGYFTKAENAFNAVPGESIYRRQALDYLQNIQDYRSRRGAK